MILHITTEEYDIIMEALNTHILALTRTLSDPWADEDTLNEAFVAKYEARTLFINLGFAHEYEATPF
jgi:hypothetical protein